MNIMEKHAVFEFLSHVDNVFFSILLVMKNKHIPMALGRNNSSIYSQRKEIFVVLHLFAMRCLFQLFI